jgi:type I restriction enzyme R subunit
MKPEELARQKIDAMLTQAGWAVQDRQRLNLNASRGVAIREFSVMTGAADYLLFVEGDAVGIIEAKKEGETLTGVEEQSYKYRTAVPDNLPAARIPLPFAYESTGVETRFTSDLDPIPRSRPLFCFHRPETLAEWLEQSPEGISSEQNNTLRARLRRLPPLITTGLRDCQVEAITKLEQSLALNKPRALIQMATGSGKTYTAVSSVYRLIKFAGAKRVLFLVDRANLARQTLNEFIQYQTPDDGRKFTELYNVQHLQHNSIDAVANVCITTIQRLYSILTGEPEFDSAEEERSLFDEDEEIESQPPKEVRYNPNVPIETFDIIITDECHRSRYNKWRGVLQYFDAFIIGLTATPNKQTFGFFNRNLVMEYGHERAVADGVNVDYQVYVIRTDITARGSTVQRSFVVGKRNRQTRAVRWESLQDDLTYSAAQLDREVVATDQIRTVIRAFKDALFTDLFPGRTEVPKTLVFAKDDNHAEEIVKIVREEFDLGNEFAQKITYKTTGSKPEELISSFRNSYNPRIAVTVDMISTGTDIKPLELLLFMRSVKSQGFFEQMKGRGTRTIDDNDFQSVTPDARTKTHFVLVDAVGVYERLKTDDPSLERKRSLPLKAVLEDIALGKWRRDEDLLYTLAGRLGRLNKRLTESEEAKIKEISGGYTTRELAKHLVEALDSDKQLEAAEAAQIAAGEPYVKPDERAIQAVTLKLIKEAVLPFSNPDLREALVQAQQRDDLIRDEVSMDRVLVSGMDVQARDQARKAITSFHEFIEQNRDEITALQIILNRPRNAPLHFSDIKQLAEAIAAPPLGLSTDKLWQAYETLDRSRVRSGKVNMKHMLTDIVSLVRYTIERDEDSSSVLEPYSETVNRRFSRWLEEQQKSRGKLFTAQQYQWLELIRDHIATSLTIEPGDFDDVPFNQHGGLGKAYQLFCEELPIILQELNERLAA